MARKRILLSEIGNYGVNIEGTYIGREMQTLINDFKPFEGLCEVQHYVVCEEYEGELETRNVEVVLVYDGVALIPLKKAYNDKRYSFVLDNDFSRKVTYDNLREFGDIFKKENPQPNYVGKPSKKKLDAWVKYVTDYQTFVLKGIETKENFKNEYLKKLEGRDIRWNNNEHTGGVIEGDGIRFKFNIYTNSVSEYVEIISYRDRFNNLEMFDKINSL